MALKLLIGLLARGSYMALTMFLACLLELPRVELPQAKRVSQTRIELYWRCHQDLNKTGLRYKMLFPCQTPVISMLPSPVPICRQKQKGSKPKTGHVPIQTYKHLHPKVACTSPTQSPYPSRAQKLRDPRPDDPINRLPRLLDNDILPPPNLVHPHPTRRHLPRQ